VSLQLLQRMPSSVPRVSVKFTAPVKGSENNEDVVVYMGAGWNVTLRQTGRHAGNSI